MGKSAIAAGIVLALIIGYGIGQVYPYTSLSHIVQSSSSSTESQVSTSFVSSTSNTTTTRLSSESGVLFQSQLLVHSAILDKLSQDTPVGYSTYIYNVTVTASVSTSCCGSFILVTSNGALIPSSPSSTVSGVLVPISSGVSVPISSVNSVNGQIAFQMANNQSPASIRYTYYPYINGSSFTEVISNLPQPSQNVVLLSVSSSLQNNFSSYTSEVSQNPRVAYSGGLKTISVVIGPCEGNCVYSVAPPAGRAPNIVVEGITLSPAGFNVTKITCESNDCTNPFSPILISSSFVQLAVSFSVPTNLSTNSVNMVNLTVDTTVA